MKTLKIVWAVVALWAVAAGSTPAFDAAGEIDNAARREYRRVVTAEWGEEVEVDGRYWNAHPDQRGLQESVASNREVLRDHEGRIVDLREDVDEVERACARLDQQTTQSTPPPNVGGGYRNPATEPEEEVSGMSTGGIVAIAAGAVMAGVLGLLLLAGLTLIVVALFVRNAQGAAPGAAPAPAPAAGTPVILRLASQVKAMVTGKPSEVDRAAASASAEDGDVSGVWERQFPPSGTAPTPTTPPATSTP